MIFNTTAKTYYYSDGTAWVAFATGGNAAALQNEVDALETALGAMINTDGTINTSAYVGTAMSAATTVTEALVALDTAMKGKDTLDEIFPATASGNVIYASGSAWAQAAPGATSGVQAWDAALDSISGLTTSADQMIYTTGSDVRSSTMLTKQLHKQLLVSFQVLTFKFKTQLLTVSLLLPALVSLLKLQLTSSPTVLS